MELVTHKKFKGDRLMPWGKGTVVSGAKGFVFLSGNTATTDDYAPFEKSGGGGWRCGGAMAPDTRQHQVGSGRARHLARQPHPADVFRQRSIPRWWRAQLAQFPPGRDGRIFRRALPETLQLQQSTAVGGDRGRRIGAARHRHRAGRGCSAAGLNAHSTPSMMIALQVVLLRRSGRIS